MNSSAMTNDCIPARSVKYRVALRILAGDVPNRQMLKGTASPNPDDSFPSSSQTMAIFQTVDVTSFSSAIDLGDRLVDLSFAYNAADANDLGVVTMSFFDSIASPLGSEVSFETSSAPTSSREWLTTALVGQVPVGTRSIQFSLAGQSVGGGSARNVSFDDLFAELVSAPAVQSRDVAHGNLIQFADNGT